MNIFDIYINNKKEFGLQFLKEPNLKDLNKDMFTFNWNVLLLKLKEQKYKFGNYTLEVRTNKTSFKIEIKYKEDDIILDSKWRKVNNANND